MVNNGNILKNLIDTTKYKIELFYKSYPNEHPIIDNLRTELNIYEKEYITGNYNICNKCGCICNEYYTIIEKNKKDIQCGKCHLFYEKLKIYSTCIR